MKNMMIKSVVMASVFFVSAGAIAAEEITKDEAKQYSEVGTVSTSGTYTDPHDAKEELSKLADEKGGKYYVITSARVEDKVMATATVYK